MISAIPGGLGAILLAGGRGSRMGGAVKPLFSVGGRSLLARAVDAVDEAGADPITVVSSPLDESLPVTWVREDPPYGGPASAVVTALGSWSVDDVPEWTLLLACDLPRVDVAVRLLVANVSDAAEYDMLCLSGRSGRRQWLIAAYRTAALREAAMSLPDRARNLPARALAASLRIRPVAASDDLMRDVDTWEYLYEARQKHCPMSASSSTKE
ncbi:MULTISPECIES: molybdenum cofactor guanylyltransferase [unclassified Microbacterium]|uniref:molybdenum cofactor guanylyltransferase n=1 Tax=unclassified Microbacterium TaxID=2609290 RepID=UPI003464EE90